MSKYIDSIFMFLLGAYFAALVIMLTLNCTSDIEEKRDFLIKECEAAIPSDQYCTWEVHVESKMK